jgi:roadblock/LC7 domain-containing protein
VDAEVLKTHLLDVISDPVQVARSKQLPFDLLQAYNIVKPLSGKMATAVSKALDASASNIPRLGDKIWLILDYSGSMGYSTDPESAFSSSLLLAASMLKANGDANNVAITLFGTEAKTLHGGVDTSGSVLSIAKDLESYRTGRIAGSTNFGAAIAERRNIGFAPDTVLVCTDGEVNGFPYNNMSGFDKDAVKVAINMRMADTTPMIKANGWQELSGWSTAIFKWIPAIREAEGVYEKLSAPYVPRVLKPRKSLATLNAVYESN